LITSLERVFFVCPNCRRLVDHVAAMPGKFGDNG
jgi:hypothetical protein